jgi:hypothetical protein
MCLAAGTGAGCDDDDGPGGGSGSGEASCTLSAGASISICEEATGLTAAQAAQIQQDCTGSGGTTAAYANGPCSRVNALGGCRAEVGPGQTATVWYYSTAGFTSADIQMLCTSAGAAFVAP